MHADAHFGYKCAEANPPMISQLSDKSLISVLEKVLYLRFVSYLKLAEVYYTIGESDGQISVLKKCCTPEICWDTSF